MKALKLVVFVVLSTFYFLFFTNRVIAQTDFITDVSVSYKLSETGKTAVTHEVMLTNASSTVYATSYTLSLENIEADNLKAYGNQGNTYDAQVTKEGDRTYIKITFPDSVVGKGATRHFFISYDNGSFATRTGEVWEVSIPRLNEQNPFRNYSVKLIVPLGFGLEAYISPKPASLVADGSERIYTFTKEDLTSTGITAGFGQFQVFSFSLSYHLENPLSTGSETQIALPPDSAFQKVYFDKISPAPDNVRIDPDGNWLAIYKMSPRQRIDVNVSGSVQIFASYRKFPKTDEETLSKNLMESEFWQVNDPDIKSLARELVTPEAIYDYVSRKLTYDYSRVQPNVQRFGAKKALENPTQAICMEFTDLFIAIARAAGIPAREVNGYAYTENPELQPLSLVADVLHAWPEYYDKERGVWIPVDPTWASTSGVDYFNKLDLRHFAFVFHGVSATKPYAPGSYKLGPNPQKDVFVSFGKLPEERVTHPVLSVVSKKTNLLLETTYKIKVANPGPGAFNSLFMTVYFDGDEESRNYVEMLPPYSNYELDIKVPFSLLGKDTPDTIKVVVESSHLEIPTNKKQVIVNSLVSIFTLFAIIIAIVIIRHKKITFHSLFVKIKAFYERLFRKTSEATPPENISK
jgi:hypothetical protein